MKLPRFSVRGYQADLCIRWWLPHSVRSTVSNCEMFFPHQVFSKSSFEKKKQQGCSSIQANLFSQLLIATHHTFHTFTCYFFSAKESFSNHLFIFGKTDGKITESNCNEVTERVREMFLLQCFQSIFKLVNDLDTSQIPHHLAQWL